MYIPPPSDLRIPTKRLQLDVTTRKLVSSPRKELFLRGPIPLEWLGEAAKLPGKTINVAIALWWRYGMAKGKPFKLTRMALKILNVKRDAASAGLARLEQAGLIQVERKPGQRPIVSILTAPRR
jgi:DNA-binding MarR family transcriptional regulator